MHPCPQRTNSRDLQGNSARSLARPFPSAGRARSASSRAFETYRSKSFPPNVSVFSQMNSISDSFIPVRRCPRRAWQGNAFSKLTRYQSFLLRKLREAEKELSHLQSERAKVLRSAAPALVLNSYYSNPEFRRRFHVGSLQQVCPSGALC